MLSHRQKAEEIFQSSTTWETHTDGQKYSHLAHLDCMEAITNTIHQYWSVKKVPTTLGKINKQKSSPKSKK